MYKPKITYFASFILCESFGVMKQRAIRCNYLLNHVCPLSSDLLSGISDLIFLIILYLPLIILKPQFIKFFCDNEAAFQVEVLCGLVS